MGFGLKRDLARYFIGTALCRLVCSCFAIPYLKNQEVSSALSRKGGWRVLFNKKDFEHNFFVKPGAQRYSKSSSYFPSDLIR